MRIRKLELQGFKSFADKAAFHFGAGISGVVGPNGCGKSNVVDGVKWCLGEQRAKTLRGDSMTDVIFGGSAGRKGVSFAEVSLTFVADDEPFPGIWARFAEIDVTRRLYRDGGSEYLINQEKVRLRDLNELFMDSGAGNQLYSFIEQGRIGQIVQAHPEQRRTLIEEAAGISRYKARREETLQKLVATRTSLERVGDLADELARQLRTAERAVQRVMRWRELSARLRQEEIAVGLARCHGLIADRRTLGQAVRAATQAMEEAARAVERTEAEVVERRAVLEALELELGEVRDALSKGEADRRVEESGQQFQVREAGSARDRLGQLERDVLGLQTERDSAAQEAAAAQEKCTEADRALPETRARAESVAAESVKLGLSVSRNRAGLDQARKESVAALEAAVHARAVLQGMAARLRDADARAVRHKERVAEAAAQDARVSDEVARIEAQLAGARATVEQAKQGVAAQLEGVRSVEQGREAVVVAVRGAEAGVRTAEQEVSRVQASVRGAEETVRKAALEVQSREAQVRAREQAWTAADRERERVLARIDSMEDALRRSTDAPDGLKQALAVPGVLGLLAPQLDVSQAREEVLARVLDGGLETVLVPDVSTAVAVARASRGAKVRVLVVSGGERSGLDDVSGTALGASALAQLAPRVLEVATVADAYAAWKPGFRVVSADGGLLREDGVLLLGIGVAGTAAFSRKREIAALKLELDAKAGALGVAAAAVSAARALVVEAEAARDALALAVRAEVARVAIAQEGVDAARALVREHQAALPAADALVRAASVTVEAARAEQRKAEGVENEVKARLESRKASRVASERAAQQWVAEGLSIERAKADLLQEEQRTIGTIAAAEVRQEAGELAVRSATRVLEAEEPQLRAAQELVSTLRMQISQLQSVVSSQGAIADAAKARVERAGARVAQVGEERSRLETRLVAIALESEQALARIQALGEQIGVLRSKLDGLRGKVSESKEAVRSAEAAARTARDRRDAARDALGKVEGQFASVRDALERLRGDVETKHEVNLVALLDRIDRDGQLLLDGWDSVPVPGLPSIPDSVPTLRLVRADLESGGERAEERARALIELRSTHSRIGEVNLSAEEEYREVADRHGEIIRQRADLDEAMRIIEDAIGQLNRTCRERFRETFDQVAEHFIEIYPRLVGGGSGRLALTNEDDLLQTGVEMYVQPPGKKVQNLSLLSGGEKAMAAIALIFALFRVKPSPFCLLDEVDAPLDEGNGERFNQMLKEMSQRSQFIIITHNKKTMECADVLYGVSMPEPGISRLVTVKLD